MNMTNQETRLLEYLKTNYTITPMEAWNELGIYRLSDVVFKLRNKNYEIETERMSVVNRFNEVCSFAEYKLLPF